MSEPWIKLLLYFLVISTALLPLAAVAWCVFTQKRGWKKIPRLLSIMLLSAAIGALIVMFARPAITTQVVFGLNEPTLKLYWWWFLATIALYFVFVSLAFEEAETPIKKSVPVAKTLEAAETAPDPAPEVTLGRAVPKPSGILTILKTALFTLGFLLSGGGGHLLATAIDADTTFSGAVLLITVGSALAYVSIFCVVGLQIVREKKFMVIECLGQFDRVLLKGLHVTFPILDTVRLEDNFQLRNVGIYSSSSPAEIDFKDASAPVTASASFRIGNPAYGDDDPRIIDDVLDWTYRFSDPSERVSEVIDGAIRPILQGYKIDEASVAKERIACDVIKEAVPGLRGTGAYLNPVKGVIIEDIKIPPEAQKLRERVLAAEKEAEATVQANSGVVRAIKAIQDNFKGADGTQISFDEAAGIWRHQVANDTLRVTGSNVNIVGSGLEGVLKTIEVGGRRA